MTRLCPIVVAHSFALGLGGCAMSAFTTPTVVVTSHRANVITPDRVKNAVTIGKTTKADVIASLGETSVIRFDTGYEVWVYRLADDANAIENLSQRIARSRSDKAWPRTPAEFVILFGPSGVVEKMRFRPAA